METNPRPKPAIQAAESATSSSVPIQDQLSACSRLANELLEAIFATLFHHRDSFRQRISQMSTLAQVCKAWKPVAEITALEIVSISMQDTDALAYLDPARSPVREALGGVHVLALTGVEEADVEDGTGTPDSGSATVEANKITKSRVAADLLLRVPNLNALLRLLNLRWDLFIHALIPVMSRLSCLPLLENLTIEMWSTWAWNRFKEEGIDLDEEIVPHDLISQHPMTGVKTLEVFDMACAAPLPKTLAAFLPLLSPEASLTSVRWAGIIAPGLCKQLAKITHDLPRLSIKCLRSDIDFYETLLPQLGELAGLKIRRLVLDLTAHHHHRHNSHEAGHPIGALLNAIPPSIRKVDAACSDPDSGLGFGFTADRVYAKVTKRPPVPILARLKNGDLQTLYHKKPLAQLCTVNLDVSGADEARFQVFAKYKRSADGDLTEWMPASPAVVDARGRVMGMVKEGVVDRL
ncbi:hypothetical protein RHOSPDRAFT_35293 [Rhodotorula sp. JG-1b]|nr:hypothetical protein RHOSPDRAFT_35293 [Rhodotorula sp. JG-1b]